MDLRYIDEPDPNLHYSEMLDYGSTSDSKSGDVEARNEAMKGYGRPQMEACKR